MHFRQFQAADLNALLKSRLNRLLVASFPDTAGDYFRRERPDRVFACLDEERLVGHLAAYKRNVLVDGAPLTIGLVGAVAVSLPHRGQGIAKRLMQEAHDYLRGENIEFSVLFAFEPERYLSSGYRLMTNQTRFVEDGQYRQFVYRGGMVAELGGGKWDFALLDLQGETV